MSDHKYSPYVVNQAARVQWKPQEEIAAAAFTGISLWLCVDTSVCVLRVFRKKKGIYFWSIFIGITGCVIDALGIILRFLTPGIDGSKLWPLYTLFLVGGWSLYAPAQLMILYSRLHLVNEIPWIQKAIFWMILSTLVTFVLPTWIGAFHSFNPDHAISSTWSPRELIIERYTQIGFTICECIVSGTYIWSLLRLLREKAAIRQKRVMTDLIYVNVLALCFDVMTVTFVYVNQGGVSHPIQNFSYALKIKLEFLVLNQLMAVAAHGVLKKSWEEKRYIHKDDRTDFSAQCKKWAGPQSLSKQTSDPFQSPILEEGKVPNQKVKEEEFELQKPTSAAPGSQTSSIRALPEMAVDATAQEPLNFHQDPMDEIHSFFDDTRLRHSRENLPSHPPGLEISKKPSDTSNYSGATLRVPSNDARVQSPHLLSRPHDQAWRRTTSMTRDNIKRRPYIQVNGNLANPCNATFRRPERRQAEAEQDNDDDEFGVHLWEKHGKDVLHAPWFKAPRPEV